MSPVCKVPGSLPIERSPWLWRGGAGDGIHSSELCPSEIATGRHGVAGPPSLAAPSVAFREAWGPLCRTGEGLRPPTPCTEMLPQ